MRNPDMSFIQQKVNSIGTALFFCGNNSPLPFSTYIITALKTDEQGCIWFFISRGSDQQLHSAAAFGVQLEFYRKGYPEIVKINGKASIIDAGAKMRELMGTSMCLNDDALSGILLIKVQIETATCKELKTKPARQPLIELGLWVKWSLHRMHLPWHPSPAVS